MKYILILCVVLALLCLLSLNDNMAVEAAKKGKKKGKSKKSKAVEADVDADGESSVAEGSSPEPVAPAESEESTESEKKSEEEEKAKPKGMKSRFVKDYKMDKIEKSWEEGDSEIELEHEFEVNRRVGQRIQNERVDMSNPKEIAKYFKNEPMAAVNFGGGGPSMMFAELKNTQANGEPWTKEAIDHIAGKWSALMRTGSLQCAVYSIGTDVNEPRFLLNVEKGWMGSEAIKFALSQPECKQVSKDSKNYTPEDLDALEELDD